MRYLIGINWFILAASSVLALVLSVVLLIYWVYRDEPVIQASFDSLQTQTGMFAGMSLLAAFATHSLRRRWTGFWFMQVLLLAALCGIVSFYLPSN